MQPLYPPKEGEIVITQDDLDNAMDIYYEEKDAEVKSKKYDEALKFLNELGVFDEDE